MVKTVKELSPKLKKRAQRMYVWFDTEVIDLYVAESGENTYLQLIAVFKIHGNTQEERI